MRPSVIAISVLSLLLVAVVVHRKNQRAARAAIVIERLLLVVGTPGSGTSQMAKDLNRIGLRTSHEDSNADQASVSWVHGMRLLDAPPSAQLLCRQKALSKGWHPMKLERGHCVDSCQTGCWNSCWRTTCAAILRRQHGCRGANQYKCLPRFRTTLLQVRHPLSTVASVVHGFCGGDGAANASSIELLNAFRGFFPQHSWDTTPSCLGQVAWFWVRYNAAALAHADNWYRVEDTAPCAVVRLAGVAHRTTCTSESMGGNMSISMSTRTATSSGGGALQPAAALAGASRAHGVTGRKNVHGEVLTYDAMWRHGGGEGHNGGGQLVDAVRGLAERLGYRD
jgi:hypothetical protein